MSKVLVVIDMQNDFIDGVLGTPEARKIAPKVAEYIRNFNGRIFFTLDIHDENYLNTQEGQKLPVQHCLCGTYGAEVNKAISKALVESGHSESVIKHTFGYNRWDYILPVWMKDTEIYICGVCTDICVIANAILLKTAFPNNKITILKDLCAGTTPEMHQKALDVMRSLHINIVNSEEI